jgi:hypothetical protein
VRPNWKIFSSGDLRHVPRECWVVYQTASKPSKVESGHLPKIAKIRAIIFLTVITAGAMKQRSACEAHF